MKIRKGKAKSVMPPATTKAGNNKILYGLITGLVALTALLYLQVLHHVFFCY